MKAAACLRRAWRAGAEPSLIRRLVLAQAVVLVVVWIALGALLMVEFQSDASELDPLRHDAVLAVSRPPPRPPPAPRAGPPPLRPTPPPPARSPPPRRHPHSIDVGR